MKKSSLKSYLLLLVSVAILVAIVIFISTDGFKSPVQRIESLIGIPIPVNATEVEAQYEHGFRDESFFIQFGLPSNEFSDFVKQICDMDTEKLTEVYVATIAERREGWPSWWLSHPDMISVGSRCDIKLSGVFLDVFVDLSNDMLYRVYLTGGTT